MKFFLSLIAIVAVAHLWVSCKNQEPAKPDKQIQMTADTLPGADSIQPVWGYRFNITGDFNGDGRADTLTEHFYSRRDKRETNKFYTGLDDVFSMCDSVHAKNVLAYVSCSDPGIAADTFYVSEAYGLGVLFLQNEGDLDGDGGDEVSAVFSFEQMSSINSCTIFTLKNGRWKELLGFEIREWEIPPTPSSGLAYGLFGNSGTYTTPPEDTLYQSMEKELMSFHFVENLKNGSVRYHTFTEIADDTTIIAHIKQQQK